MRILEFQAISTQQRHTDDNTDDENYRNIADSVFMFFFVFFLPVGWAHFICSDELDYDQFQIKIKF